MRSLLNNRLSFVGATDIQEYLLLKGVEAVAIHGSKCMSRHSLFHLSDP